MQGTGIRPNDKLILHAVVTNEIYSLIELGMIEPIE
jgi:hypothetical protein